MNVKDLSNYLSSMLRAGKGESEVVMELDGYYFSIGDANLNGDMLLLSLTDVDDDLSVKVIEEV